MEVLLSNSWAEIRTAGPTLVPILKQAVSQFMPKISPKTKHYYRERVRSLMVLGTLLAA
jgi:hypothetical protein